MRLQAQVRAYGFADAVVGADQEGRPAHTDTEGPVDAECPDGVFAGIGKQRVCEAMPVAEARVSLGLTPQTETPAVASSR